MSPDYELKQGVSTMVYDAGPRSTAVRDRPQERWRQPSDTPGGAPEEKKPPPYTFEQDREKGVFRLLWSDGNVEVFRDKPVRYLAVEPDSNTGEMKPLLTHGLPTFLYLCREEREIR
jgi:hypothetical protein